MTRGIRDPDFRAQPLVYVSLQILTAQLHRPRHVQYILVICSCIIHHSGISLQRRHASEVRWLGKTSLLCTQVPLQQSGGKSNAQRPCRRNIGSSGPRAPETIVSLMTPNLLDLIAVLGYPKTMLAHLSFSPLSLQYANDVLLQ
jgi:hypothetical protein